MNSSSQTCTARSCVATYVTSISTLLWLNSTKQSKKKTVQLLSAPEPIAHQHQKGDHLRHTCFSSDLTPRNPKRPRRDFSSPAGIYVRTSNILATSSSSTTHTASQVLLVPDRVQLTTLHARRRITQKKTPVHKHYDDGIQKKNVHAYPNERARARVSQPTDTTYQRPPTAPEQRQRPCPSPTPPPASHPTSWASSPRPSRPS
jgi:hypothetical protein